jgi:transposase InsO family protein
VRTTVPEPADAKAPDLLKRDFTAEQPNTKYVGDIAYLPLADGNNLYLATVIDCCSRKLAGWAVADHMRTSLVEDALNAARADRGSLRGAISTPTTEPSTPSKDFATLCGTIGVVQSLGGVGSSADNALAESFNATLKREAIAAAFADEATCRREIFRWATRYNTRRQHAYLGQHGEEPSEKWSRFLEYETEALDADEACRADKYREGLALLEPRLREFRRENANQLVASERAWGDLLQQAQAQGYRG